MTSAIFSLPLWSNSKLYAEDYRDKGWSGASSADEDGAPIDFELLAGEQLAIVGDNGSGKTRLVEVG